MKITYATLLNKSFAQALAKLASHNKYEQVRDAYNVSKIFRAVREEFDIGSRLELDLVKKYATLDDKGEITLNERGEYTVPEEKAEEFRAKKKELYEQEIEIDRPAINLQTLVGCELSPLELEALEPLLNPLQLAKQA
jgi:hypothetical protein